MKDSIPHTQDTLINAFDSVPINSDTIVYSELFGGNLKVIDNNFPSSGVFESIAPDWLSLVFVGAIIYFIIIKFVLNINLINGFYGLLKIEVLDEVGFEKTNRSIALLLSPYATIVYAYYLYFMINPKYLEINFDYLFLVFSIVISLLFIFKKIIEYVISYIFNAFDSYKAYLFDHLYLLGISSVIQLFLLVFYTYSQLIILLWIAIGTMFIFFTFRLIRSFIIGFRLTSFSKSYLFLYLCSLEILPLIWIYKIITDYQ